MSESQQHLETLHEIRELMEKSSRFISLSGLSGVFAGIFALAGAAFAFVILQADSFLYAEYTAAHSDRQTLLLLLLDSVAVLAASLTVAVILTTRQARRKGQTVWGNTAKRLLLNLFIPLATGGIFCLALLYHNEIGLIPPAMLVFYGLSLLNGSKYTLHDIRYLGVSEIALGLVALFFIGYGLLFWAIGFGMLHIVYGMVMYRKYEKNG
jgi:hypothetical protein